jgi:hypothetical protein
MGIGSITFSLPHFLAGNYMVHTDPNTTSDNICKVSKLSQAQPPPEIDILGKLPGLDKIKSLTEGESNGTSRKWLTKRWHFGFRTMLLVTIPELLC